MGCTILVADADTLQGGHIADELKFHGYQVATISDGPGVLNMARCQVPDVIILDLMLPEMDGLEVCRRLRRARNTAATPIIMISSSGDEFDTVVSLEVGADAFMTKPISHRELLARIRSLLRRSGSICVSVEPPEALVFHPFPTSNGELAAGPLRINLNGWLVTCRGKEIIMPDKRIGSADVSRSPPGNGLVPRTIATGGVGKGS